MLAYWQAALGSDLTRILVPKKRTARQSQDDEQTSSRSIYSVQPSGGGEYLLPSQERFGVGRGSGEA